MKIFNFFLLILLALEGASQNTTIEYLDINNVKAGFLNRGDMFWNPDTQSPSYEFPKGSGKHSNFAAALWVSGINQNTNKLHVSAQTYRQKGNDFWPGPMYTEVGPFYVTIDSVNSEKWDKIWKVNKSTIDSFINSVPHTVANTPQEILDWPGKKNIYAKGKNGISIAVEYAIAPFVDVNNDSKYNALDGDYPKIKGEQALFWIFNDHCPHKETNSTSMNIEISGMAYACNSIASLKNAIFVEYKIRNYSTHAYLNTRFSFREDIDLGNFADDYLGVDTIRRMGICYNGDNNDDGLGYGYGNNLTQSAAILLKMPNDSVGYKEPLGGYVFYENNLLPTGNPIIDTEYIHYMNNKWADGQPFTDACNARYAGNTIKYAYPSEPDDPAGWSERKCINSPGDRRFLINSNSFTMIPTVAYEFGLAFVNTPPGSSNVDFSILKSFADSVIQYADGCSSSWTLNTNDIINAEYFSLIPNPATYEIEIKASQLLRQKIDRIEIYAPDGILISNFDKKQIFQNRINIRHLTNGLYFVKLLGEGKTLTNKFMKN